MDTTHFKLPFGKKLTTCFVSDNFSRNILGCSIGDSAKSGLVVDALKQTIGVIKKYHSNELSTMLVSDKGSENTAKSVGDYIGSTSSIDIKQLIAQRDVMFSNSPVEAINKIYKKYLRILNP